MQIEINQPQPARLIVAPASDSARTIEIAPWSPEEAEHYAATGQTPLGRRHRQALAEMWADSDASS